MSREDLRLKYEEKRKRLGLEAKWGDEETREVRLVQEHAVYAGMVEAMDLAVGRVLDKLDELGLAENTLVIFTSDNGGLSTSEGWPTSNLPLRAGKGWMYEGGIREPLIMRWPATIKPGTVIATPVSSPDFFPTFLDVAGIKPQAGQTLDGVSLLPLFKGGAQPDRALFWHYPHYGNQGGAPSAAIRRGDWKLIRIFHGGGNGAHRHLLFNLSDDPGEKNNLAAQRPELVRDLDALIDTFLADKYEPVDGNDERYTHIGSSSHGGLVVYDEDTFAYSHHENDPCSGREVNSFDLVRLHKFGRLDDRASENTNMDKLPSYTAMLAFATQDVNVKKDRLAELSEDFAGVDDEVEVDEDAWIDKLKVSDKTGLPLPTAENIETILMNGPWRDVLAYDAFGNSEVIRDRLPWRERERPTKEYEPWLGEDDDRRDHWFDKTFNIRSALPIKKAFTEVTRRNKFHPIKTYLESNTWDGVPRAERLFIRYLGAADTPYVKQTTRKMLLAAVTRLYNPGCKFDYMLVLVGPQGAGKSSLLAKLGRDWFSDSLRTFENKEAGEHLQNGWIFEIGELSALKKTEVEEVKAFLSKTEDRYRVAYDRQVSEFPRKCVFFGTTNTRDFLRDASGNRRFWPMVIDPTKAEADHWKHLTDSEVSQIWAEVLGWFRKGETLELDINARQEAERQQAEHLENDPREGMIQEWLNKELTDNMGDPNGVYLQEVCASQIWSACLGNRTGQLKAWESKEIMDIMRRQPEWEEQKVRVRMEGYGRQTVFHRRK
jgi:hypothetical protein